MLRTGLIFCYGLMKKMSRYVGKNVIVIGGGYTSMDCARTALRLGYEICKNFYRREQGDLDIPGELEELVNENGKMIFRTDQTSYLQIKEN